MVSQWRRTWAWIPLFLSLIVACSSCRTAYYSFWEKLGKQKRDLLKDNLQAVKEDQKKASDQFTDALTRLKELYGFQGGDLESKYDQLKHEYDQSATKAKAVQDRIQKVEQISRDLFDEWEREIQSMTSSRLRESSRTKLDETREKYQQLHASMKRAEQSMEPILTQFHDQVLYLKHNLNAQAVGALKGESDNIEKEIGRLIDEMRKSIAQADAFIKTLP